MYDAPAPEPVADGQVDDARDMLLGAAMLVELAADDDFPAKVRDRLLGGDVERAPDGVAAEIGALRPPQHFDALDILQLRVDRAVGDGRHREFVEVDAHRVDDRIVQRLDVANAADTDADAPVAGLAIVLEADVRRALQIVGGRRDVAARQGFRVKGCDADRNVLKRLRAPLRSYDDLAEAEIGFNLGARLGTRLGTRNARYTGADKQRMHHVSSFSGHKPSPSAITRIFVIVGELGILFLFLYF